MQEWAQGGKAAITYLLLPEGKAKGGQVEITTLPFSKAPSEGEWQVEIEIGIGNRRRNRGLMAF